MYLMKNKLEADTQCADYRQGQSIPSHVSRKANFTHSTVFVLSLWWCQYANYSMLFYFFFRYVLNNLINKEIHAVKVL